MRRFLATSASTSRWLQRQRRDRYVRDAAATGKRSRAAYKLLQVDARWRLLRPGCAVVDLGAAPGGWSEVAAQRVRANGPGGDAPVAPHPVAPAVSTSSSTSSAARLPAKRRSGATPVWELAGTAGCSTGHVDTVASNTAPTEASHAVDGGIVVAVDLQPIDLLHGVLTVQGNFTQPHVRQHVCSLLPHRRADVVLSDMAPAFTGHSPTDSLRQMALAWEAFHFATSTLCRGGHLLLKTRYCGQEGELVTAGKAVFDDVRLVKPDASRSDSAEVFVLCRRLRAAA